MTTQELGYLDYMFGWHEDENRFQFADTSDCDYIRWLAGWNQAKEAYPGSPRSDIASRVLT